MSIQIDHMDATLSDPSYLASLIADLTAHEPRQEYGMLVCVQCGNGEVVYSGLCNACAWAEFYEPNYDVYDEKDYAGKHGGWPL